MECRRGMSCRSRGTGSAIGAVSASCRAGRLAAGPGRVYWEATVAARLVPGRRPNSWKHRGQSLRVSPGTGLPATSWPASDHGAAPGFPYAALTSRYRALPVRTGPGRAGFQRRSPGRSTGAGTKARTGHRGRGTRFRRGIRASRCRRSRADRRRSRPGATRAGDARHGQAPRHEPRRQQDRRKDEPGHGGERVGGQRVGVPLTANGMAAKDGGSGLCGISEVTWAHLSMMTSPGSAGARGGAGVRP